MIASGIDFLGALSHAYRRAVGAGLPVVGTDLVLYCAQARTSALQKTAPSLLRADWRPVRRGRSGLEDPEPPPDNSRLTPSLDDDVAFLTVATLREAAYQGADRARVRGVSRRRAPQLPVFSPAVRYAVYEGLDEAARSGMSHAGVVHLIVGLLSVPEGAAARVLVRLTGEDWGPGSALVRRLTSTARTAPGVPSLWGVGNLVAYRVLPARREPRFWTGLWRLGNWLLTETLMRRPYRRHGARYGHPILLVVDGNATVEAVRAGHDVVTGAHLVVSLLALHQQLAADGRALPADVARWNQAGHILARHGATQCAAARAVVEVPPDPVDEETRLDDLPTQGWYRLGPRLVAPAHGRTELAALRAASIAAHRHGHPYAGTTHLLVELLADPAGPAARLLRRLDVDPEAVRLEAHRSLPSQPG